jgi:hypothetical protein
VSGLGALLACLGLLVAGVTPTPARAQVPAGVDPRLFVIGDSVLLGAQDAIVARMTGWQVNVYAQEGLSTLAAPRIINASRPLIGEVVVVALGNNDAGNPVTFGQRVDGVMQAIGPARRVIWVNLRSFASFSPAFDQQLTAAATRWPTLDIADWSTTGADPSLVYRDGLHLTPPGRTVMAQLIATHVSAYVQQRLAASTTTTTTTTTPAHRRGRSTTLDRGSAEPADVPLVLGVIGLGATGVLVIASASTWRRRRKA